MPESMRDEFSYAARVRSGAIGGQVKPGIFQAALNTVALEYALAVLGRRGPISTKTRGLITVKNLEDYTTAGAILLVLLLMIATAWWWLPQKWQACEQLYDNKPAQIFCLLASQ